MNKSKELLRNNKAEIRRLKRHIEFLELENKHLEMKIEEEKFDRTLFEGATK
jgi:hypothetical protein